MTMIKKTTALLVLLISCFYCLQAQIDDDEPQPRPSNGLEAGVHGGYLFVAGDVSPKFGYGAGLHVRKALDYVFSIRLDLLYGKAKGENDFSNFSNTWYSATGFGVLSFNNFKFEKGQRRFNYYFMLGGGGNNFRTMYTNKDVRMATRPFKISAHAGIGAGIAMRISKRINIGIEHQAMVVFGRRADLVDGIEGEGGVKSPFRDIVNYSNIRININLGKRSGDSSPLYWKNPLDVVLNEIQNGGEDGEGALPEFEIEDTDGDGVIDAIDQEPDTPIDVPVDTKGRTLDSDRDGVPDYKDKEPYYPPRAGERVDSEGVVVNPMSGGPGGGVTEERVQEMIDEALKDFRLTESGSTFTDWFLPMIHFGTDSKTIKYSDYGTLASIARMMKSNPQLRLVVTGYTDQTAPENYNNELSYARALSVVDHLVDNHGIGRGRLVLQWKGEGEAIVPSASNFMNRRVEFRVATPSDFEMDAPAGGNKIKGY